MKNFTDDNIKTTRARSGGNIPLLPRPHSVAEAVAQMCPALPLYVLSPESLRQNAREFMGLFPGETLYAVKCNPDKEVLQTLYRAGMRAFDAASIEEVRQVRRWAPKAKIYFMHPVKAPEAIRAAYFEYGVRAFVLDTQEELYKILRETGLAADLELFVRLALPKNGSAKIDFAAKFGAAPDEAARLLGMARNVCARLGLAFHVGTQTTDPAAYRKAIAKAAATIKSSGVRIDVLDIGGGFPATYPDTAPPALPLFIKEIVQALHDYKLSHLPLIAEPGRALVAACGTLVVRVEQRRGNLLYLNDGTYGGLFDAGKQLNMRYPVQLLRNGRKDDPFIAEKPFRFAGPTCDSLDMMDGPFFLPDDVRTGDWIEIANMGAYSAALRGNFNGFGKAGTVVLSGETNRDK